MLILKIIVNALITGLIGFVLGFALVALASYFLIPVKEQKAGGAIFVGLYGLMGGAIFGILALVLGAIFRFFWH